jgi:hypothetical protein
MSLQPFGAHKHYLTHLSAVIQAEIMGLVDLTWNCGVSTDNKFVSGFYSFGV